jgi:hypothetical protein
MKFLNKPDSPAVFMIEVKRLVAGEAVLSEAVTVDDPNSKRQVSNSK